MRVVVIGAGIGGLAAGIALRRAGIDAQVFERASVLEEVGAGLVIAPNGVRALDLLGLGDAVRDRGSAGTRMTVRAASGTTLLAVELEAELQTVGIHRADLHGILRDALGAESLQLGRECVRFDDDGRGVVVRFADGEEERGDVLVGADGIRSIVRERLHGEGPPVYAGYAGWRAVVAGPSGSVAPGTFSESWGRGDRFGIVDIGRGRVYWFVSELTPEGGWERSDVKADLLRRLSGWHEPVEALVAATPEDSISGLGIYDRPVRSDWGRGRVTLLGDAAHPMTPNLGQGACQALEDAVVLASCLRGADDPVAGLRRYEQRRAPRTAAIVRRSRQLGRFAHARGPVTSRLRDLVMRATPPRAQLRQQRQILDVDLA